MADEKEVDNDTTQDEKTQQPSSDSQEEESGSDKEKWVAEAKKRGFKDPEALWKSYREAEKKISKQGEKLKEAEIFQKQVSPVLETVWQDDVILNRLRSKVNQAGNNQGQPSSSSDQDQSSNQVNNSTQQRTPQTVDREARAAIMEVEREKFESSHGLDKLDEETLSDVRAKIGKQAAKWVGDLRRVQPNQLSGILDDAFAVVSQRDESLKKMLETSGDSNNTGEGELSSASSGGSSEEGDIKLTPEQRKTARKMGVSDEAYKKGLKKLMGK